MAGRPVIEFEDNASTRETLSVRETSSFLLYLARLPRYVSRFISLSPSHARSRSFAQYINFGGEKVEITVRSRAKSHVSAALSINQRDYREIGRSCAHRGATPVIYEFD